SPGYRATVTRDHSLFPKCEDGFRAMPHARPEPIFIFSRNASDSPLRRDDGALRRDHRRGLAAVGAGLAALAALTLAARLVVQPGLEETGLLDLARRGGFARRDRALGRRQYHRGGDDLLVLLQ